MNNLLKNKIKMKKELNEQLDILDEIFGIVAIDELYLSQLKEFLRKNDKLNLKLVGEFEEEFNRCQLVDILKCNNKHYFLIKKY